jgi:hypothetical protein
MILVNIDARDRILQHFAAHDSRTAGGRPFLLSDKMLVERFDDNVLYFGRGNTGDRSD